MTIRIQKEVVLFRVFFYTRIKNNENVSENGIYKFENVMKWSRRVHKGDIFSLDKLFVPINEHKTHWLVVVVFFDQKRIAVFDSMHSGKGENYLRILFRYIQDEHRRKHATELTEKEKWKLVTSKATAPHQSNCESFKTKQKNHVSLSLSHTHTVFLCCSI
jgi:Ulp1 family protease